MGTAVPGRRAAPAAPLIVTARPVTVLDLRTEREIAERGRLDVDGIDWHHLPVPQETWDPSWATPAVAAERFLADRYLTMLAEGEEVLGRPCACSPRLPAVLHCAAGKDRTGALAALVLALVGVDDDTIAADYGLAPRHGPPRRVGAGHLPGAVRHHGRPAQGVPRGARRRHAPLPRRPASCTARWRPTPRRSPAPTSSTFSAPTSCSRPQVQTDLRGHVALITGGNGGIGLGMAMGLARAGADVAIWGTTPAKNEAAAARIAQVGTQVHTEVCDVADEAAQLASFDRTVDVLGKVDSVFANAGMGGVPSFVDLTLEEAPGDGGHRRCLRVLRLGARHLVERGEGGSLVAVSSTSAIHGAQFNPHYGVEDGALGLVRAYRRTWPATASGSTPSCPAGPTSSIARSNQKFIDATIGRTPVRRCRPRRVLSGASPTCSIPPSPSTPVTPSSSTVATSIS